MAVTILLLVISCGAIAAGLGYVRTARRARSFATTRGRVVAREVVALAGGAREGRWGRGGGYQPRATYTYVVDGATYTSNRWSYAGEGLKRSVAEAALAAVGDEVDVHYDPGDPAEAYLNLPTGRLGQVLVGAGVVGLCVGALAILAR